MSFLSVSDYCVYNIQARIRFYNEISDTDVIFRILIISQFDDQGICSVSALIGSTVSVAALENDRLIERDAKHLSCLCMISIVYSVYLKTVISSSCLRSLMYIC